MIQKTTYIAFETILRKEISRFLRIWVQSFLPSIITITLYFIIFGNLIGRRIGTMHGIPYTQYIAPGLVMMAVITNSYVNVASSFYGARFQGEIDELLISPTPDAFILLGFVSGGVTRGLIVGAGVIGITLLFSPIYVHHYLITFMTLILCSLLFSLAGFTNAIFAKKFDDVSIIPTFILTPLTYLGGVFYSIDLLPKFWYHLSLGNPILYMVNTFRYGLIGISDVNIFGAFIMIISCIILLFILNLYLLKKGIGIRS